MKKNVNNLFKVNILQKYWMRQMLTKLEPTMDKYEL